MKPFGKPTDDWLVVLRPDGIVDAVEGGAPVDWLGHRLAGAAGVSDEVRSGAAALLTDTPGSGYVHRRTFRMNHEGRSVTVELLLVEGLPMRKAHTSVSELIMRTLDVFIAQAQSSNVDLTVQQSAAVPRVYVLDGEKIAWALATLVGNALRFAQKRGSPKHEPHVHVHVDWAAAEQELVISVRDNGPGMSERHSKWLFDPDPETGKASGLALLMVRDVVVAHRGLLEVDSALGRGTTFTMRLPHL